MIRDDDESGLYSGDPDYNPNRPVDPLTWYLAGALAIAAIIIAILL